MIKTEIKIRTQKKKKKKGQTPDDLASLSVWHMNTRIKFSIEVCFFHSCEE